MIPSPLEPKPTNYRILARREPNFDIVIPRLVGNTRILLVGLRGLGTRMQRQELIHLMRARTDNI